MTLKSTIIIYFFIGGMTSFCFAQSKSTTPQLCKDTNYFVRNSFVYCDSIQPKSCVYKKGRFYEVKKYNEKGEGVLKHCKTDYRYPKYFIFTTKSGKKIEEGFYSGIWETKFSQGEYKAYYENGNLLCKGSYVDSYKIGVWLYYSELGKLTKQEEYGDKEVLINTKNF